MTLMKFFLNTSLAIAGSALLGACAATQPTPVFQAPSVAPVKQAVTRVEQHVQGAQGAARKLADECAQKSAGWQAAYNQLMQELTDAYVDVQTAQSLADELQKQNDAQATQSNKVASDKAKAEVARDKAIGQYHRAKFFGSIEAGLIFLALGAVIGFRLLPPPYGFLALGAGPVATLLFDLLL
jgi:hypothetical protein